MADSQLELDEKTHEEIKRLCALGDDLAQQSRYDEAIAEYNKAWKLVPDPANEWEASTWILAAIGDACFFGRYYSSARDALEYAMACPGGRENPFLHLRLGQVLFEQNLLDEAASELMLAYMGAGSDIFASEDPKYQQFLATRAKI